MRDIRAAGVDVLTLGQYLRPTEAHLAVVEYVTPELFAWFQEQAEGMGFRYVASGPMVRSSYKAGEFFMNAMIDEDAKEEAQAGGAQADGEQAPINAEEQAEIDAAVAVAWLESRGIRAPPKREQQHEAEVVTAAGRVSSEENVVVEKRELLVDWD